MIFNQQNNNLGDVTNQTGRPTMYEETAKMNLADAETELRNRIYEATNFLSGLEAAGKISGNSHHARQKMAELAVAALRSRWILTERSPTDV